MKPYNIETDGITQGAMAQFQDCRQKARWYLKGWSVDRPPRATIFGNIAHGVIADVCEAVRLRKLTTVPSNRYIDKCLEHNRKIWLRDNPRSNRLLGEDLEFALTMGSILLPMYFAGWANDIKKKKWLRIEKTFAIPYTLPDGRKTILRGRPDGGYEERGLWLLETKTKSRIDENALVDYLPFELQNRWYLNAFRKIYKRNPKGVLYNIIRKIQLQQRKKETLKEFIKRCIEDVESRPEWYFIRYEIQISPRELDAAEGEIEDMIKDFYDWWTGVGPHYRSTGHCETKYGRCDYLGACVGRMNEYRKRPTVFRELEDL